MTDDYSRLVTSKSISHLRFDWLDFKRHLVRFSNKMVSIPRKLYNRIVRLYDLGIVSSDLAKIVYLFFMDEKIKLNLGNASA